MSYKKLEIWQIANELVIKIHNMTLVFFEGYGRRVYKQDFLRFLVSSIASNDETIDHLENLYNTESLKNKQLYFELHEKIEILGRKLNNFINAVQIKHNLVSEPESYYNLPDVENLES